MIYTVTFNPSLDYIVSVENFQLGLTNRTSSEMLLPGGKGINVSTVLMNLGIESTALGFTAGFTGDEIIRRLEEMGVRNGFIQVGEGFSRINLKLKSIDGTEINGQPEFEEYVDVVQIGARNMQNFQLLKAVGKMHKPVLLKRGLCNTIEEWIMSAEYIMAGGNEQVILCERGIRTFEKYTRNTLDLSTKRPTCPSSWTPATPPARQTSWNP